MSEKDLTDRLRENNEAALKAAIRRNATRDAFARAVEVVTAVGDKYGLSSTTDEIIRLLRKEGEADE